MSTAIPTYDLYIDGTFVSGSAGDRFPSINPSTGKTWATVPFADSDMVDRAVTAANRAFKTWSHTSPKQRAKLVRELSARLAEAADDVARIETIDTGKLYKETRGLAHGSAALYAYYAGLAENLDGHVPPSADGRLLNIVSREPLGVVAAVVPWNSQLLLSVHKLGPALVTGNTVVVKASEDAACPLLELARVIDKVGFPPGVINFITGPGEPTGVALTSHPLVRRIAFTGGAETARRILPNTTHNLARVSLELGGKSPMIVFDDADLDNAVNGMVSGIFAASGQSCGAASRLLLQDNIYDAFLDKLSERASRIRLGDPLDPQTEMGPLATARQRERIGRLVDESLSMPGSRVVFRGERPAAMPDGFFFEPLIIAFDDQEFPVVRNELFGPVLSVLRFSDEDEAIALADDSDYAFAAGIFTQNFPRAHRVASRIQAGKIAVNTYRVSTPNVPFGGFRLSGYGREGGADALKDYTDTKAILVDVTGDPIPDPFVMA